MTRKRRESDRPANLVDVLLFHHEAQGILGSYCPKCHRPHAAIIARIGARERAPCETVCGCGWNAYPWPFSWPVRVLPFDACPECLEPRNAVLYTACTMPTVLVSVTCNGCRSGKSFELPPLGPRR